MQSSLDLETGFTRYQVKTRHGLKIMVIVRVREVGLCNGSFFWIKLNYSLFDAGWSLDFGWEKVIPTKKEAI